MSVKKYQIAPFLNTAVNSSGLVNTASPTWTRIKKTTSFDLNMNPQTEERDFISDKNPTIDLLRYAPTFNTPLVMYKGEADYEFIFGKFFNLAVGEKAKAEVMLVFYQEPVDGAASPTHFLAWKAPCSITINDLNSVDETITFDVSFNGKTDVGYATVAGNSITFTKGTYS